MEIKVRVKRGGGGVEVRFTVKVGIEVRVKVGVEVRVMVG